MTHAGVHVRTTYLKHILIVIYMPSAIPLGKSNATMKGSMINVFEALYSWVRKIILSFYIIIYFE